MAISEPSKPRLYLDIDGVVYGWYGGQWQMRPYVVTLVAWATQHFDVKWLSFNSRREQIASILYAELPQGDMSHSDDPEESERKGRWEKLRAIEREGDGIEGDWLIIEDTPPTLDAFKVLKERNSLHKWVLVPETGADVLLDVKIILEQWLVDRKMRIPRYWKYADYKEKSLCLYDEWEGPREEQCEK